MRRRKARGLDEIAQPPKREPVGNKTRHTSAFGINEGGFLLKNLRTKNLHLTGSSLAVKLHTFTGGEKCA